MDPEPLEVGAGAAVYVPYTKKRKEWIIAAVSRFLPETREYIVKDQFPDTRRKVDTWKVKEREILRYPAPPDEVFNVSDKVLSLWMMENKEWSSMFYEAVIAAPAVKDDLQLRFPGEDAIIGVPRSKVVRLPNRPPKVPTIKVQADGSVKTELKAKSEDVRSPTDKQATATKRPQEGSNDDEASDSKPKRRRSESPESRESSPDSPGSAGASPTSGLESPSADQPPAASVTQAAPPAAGGGLNPDPPADNGVDQRGLPGPSLQECGVLAKKRLKYQQLLAARAKAQQTS